MTSLSMRTYLSLYGIYQVPEVIIISISDDSLFERLLWSDEAHLMSGAGDIVENKHEDSQHKLHQQQEGQHDVELKQPIKQNVWIQNIKGLHGG